MHYICRMIRTLTTKILAYSLLCMLCFVGPSVMAQDSLAQIDGEDIDVVYGLESFNFFDNREVHSPYQIASRCRGWPTVRCQ